MSDEKLKRVLELITPGLDASIDPVCVVDTANKILHLSASMKAFLSVRPRELSKGLVFCDLLKLSACESGCKILHTIKSGTNLRLDETPASRGDMKLRVVLKAVPLYDPEDKSETPIGAIISVRDTTGEILVQAKYHKLMQIIEDEEHADLRAQQEDRVAAPHAQGRGHQQSSEITRPFRPSRPPLT